LLSSILGGLFAMCLALLSPEYIQGLFVLKEGVSAVRYASTVGMIWGLFIGAAVGGFSAALSVLLNLIRLRIQISKTEAKK